MKHRAASIRQMSAPTVRASEPINSSRQAASHKPRWATASKLMTKTPVPATRKPYGQPTSSNNNNQLQLQLQPMRTSKLHVAIKTRRRRQQRRLVTSSSSAQPRVLANCRTYADDADFTTITSPLLPSTPIVALALLVIATGTACWTSTGQHQSKLIGLVEAAPIQLVADFSTYAFSVLANQQQQQLEAMHRQLSEQVAASNSLRAGFASGGSPNGPDEDPDEVAADNAAAHAAAAQNDSIPVTGIGGESFSSLLRSDFGANQDDEDDLQSLNETTVMVAAGTTTNTNSMTNSSLDLANRPLLVTSTSGAGGPAAGPSTKMRTGPGVTGGHFIYLPNGQSVQFCEESKAELGCLDANAVCKMGACVCKPGFFQTRQSSLCQSISDLLKNCENDLQCQAFNVDLVCDTKSHERPFCDCTPGLYFDQETHTCFPCHRNTFIFTTTTSGGGTTGESSPMIGLGDTVSKTTNSTATNGTTAGSASASTTATILPNAAGGTSAASATTTLKPCRPIDIAKIKLKQRLFNLLPSFPPGYDDSGERLQVLASGAGMSSSNTAAGAPTISSAHPNSVHSSDPFRIKTPLEVFMGAIMLFTLFTVAWFFLQRIIHDCRTIMKSIRAGTDEMMAGGDPNFTGAFGTSTTHHTTAHHLSGLGGESSLEVAAMGGHHSLGPGGGLQSAASSLAAARFAAALASGADPDYMETSPGFFARRRSANSPGIGYMATTLAGAYHRSLAAGLMAAANGAGGTNSATTTLSSSHTTTPLATAVTNSGQNSAATRSAITRLVGDDTDDELVASIYPFIESPSSYHHGGGGREVGRNNATAGFEHHPGLAILRVAMAAQSRLANYPSHHQFPPGCMPINYLNPNFEPPPKYEEAIAQDNGCQQPNYLQNHHHHHPHNQTTVSPSSPVSSRGATPTNIDQPTVTNNMSINDDEEELQHNSHNRHEQENTNQLDQNRSSTVSPPTGTQSSQSGDISSGDNNNNTQNCTVTNTINGEPADINEHNNWDNNSHSN